MSYWLDGLMNVNEKQQLATDSSEVSVSILSVYFFGFV